MKLDERFKALTQFEKFPGIPSTSLVRITFCFYSQGCGDSRGTLGERDQKNTLVANDLMPLRLGLGMLWALCSTY
jgi:hypothetical protein